MAHDTEELEHDAARGALEPQRDLPLTFRWRTDLRAIAALGLAPARTSRHDDARNAVLTEAELAYERNSWVSFSRRPAWYVGRHRYYGHSYGYEPVLSAVADGVNAGLLEERRASPRTRGRQSRFHGTPLLHAFLSGAPIRPHLHEVIWLRDDRRRLINYGETTLTRRLRKEIEAINTVMAEIEVDLAGPDVQRVGSYWIVSGTGLLPASARPPRVQSRFVPQRWPPVRLVAKPLVERPAVPFAKRRTGSRTRLRTDPRTDHLCAQRLRARRRCLRNRRVSARLG